MIIIVFGYYISLPKFASSSNESQLCLHGLFGNFNEAPMLGPGLICGWPSTKISSSDSYSMNSVTFAVAGVTWIVIIGVIWTVVISVTWTVVIGVTWTVVIGVTWTVVLDQWVTFWSSLFGHLTNKLKIHLIFNQHKSLFYTLALYCTMFQGLGLVHYYKWIISNLLAK